MSEPEKKFGATHVAHNLPSELSPGAVIAVRLTLQNTSSFSWRASSPVRVEKGRVLFRVRPFLRGDFPDLHQPDLPARAARFGIEPALPPDHRLDQQRIHPVTRRRRLDLRRESLLQPLLAPEINHRPARPEQSEQ